MLDSQFLLLREIRKKSARKMKKIMQTLKKAAAQAMELENKMQMKAAKILLVPPGSQKIPLASFAPDGSIQDQLKKNYDAREFVCPDFDDIRTFAQGVINMADSAEKDNSVVISKPDQPAYARRKYGIKNLPPNWHPAGIPTTTYPPTDPSEYCTPDGGWVVRGDEGGSLPP